jgi:predicted GNAT family acetyltransferase
MTMDEIHVNDNPAQSRYEIRVGEALAGFLDYRVRGDVVSMLHTEIDPEVQTKGLGTRLVADALADTQARGRTVKPYCPFVAAYIREHPQYEDLVSG